MVLYPDVQRKARAQIDVVCQGRLPDIMDRDALPYVTALVKESVRWHNVVPLSQYYYASSLLFSMDASLSDTWKQISRIV